MIDLSLFELTSRILVAVFFGGIIGYDREVTGQSAGFRTHMLVCVGAAMIALIQVKSTNQVLSIVSEYPEFIPVFTISQTRLIAQIVSGIGFLGAGAIIVTKRSVSGLTTAASIWTTAGVGIALGFGYYEIAIIGTFIIVVVLALLKNKLRIAAGENLVVHYLDKDAQNKIITYFEDHQIRYFSAEFRVENDTEHQQTIYTEHYILNLPSGQFISGIIQDIGELDSVIYASSQHNIV